MKRAEGLLEVVWRKVTQLGISTRDTGSPFGTLPLLALTMCSTRHPEYEGTIWKEVVNAAAPSTIIEGVRKDSWSQGQPERGASMRRIDRYTHSTTVGRFPGARNLQYVHEQPDTYRVRMVDSGPPTENLPLLTSPSWILSFSNWSLVR